MRQKSVRAGLEGHSSERAGKVWLEEGDGRQLTVRGVLHQTEEVELIGSDENDQRV